MNQKRLARQRDRAHQPPVKDQSLKEARVLEAARDQSIKFRAEMRAADAKRKQQTHDDLIARTREAILSYNGRSLDRAAFDLYHRMRLYVEQGDQSDAKLEQMIKQFEDHYQTVHGRPITPEERNLAELAIVEIMQPSMRLRIALLDVEKAKHTPPQCKPYITVPMKVMGSMLFRAYEWPELGTARTFHGIRTWSYPFWPFWSNGLPLLRDAAGKPMALTEELGADSIVQVAVGADGLMTAVKIIEPVWPDPFAEEKDR